MPENLVRFPITLMGNFDKPVGFVMIEAYMVKEIEMFSQMWGVGFKIAVSLDGKTEKLEAVDIYPHEAIEGQVQEMK